MGVEMASLGFEQTWVVIDLLLTSSAVDLPDRTIQYCNLTGQPPIAGMLGGGGGNLPSDLMRRQRPCLRRQLSGTFLPPWLAPRQRVLNERRSIPSSLHLQEMAERPRVHCR